MGFPPCYTFSRLLRPVRFPFPSFPFVPVLQWYRYFFFMLYIFILSLIFFSPICLHTELLIFCVYIQFFFPTPPLVSDSSNFIFHNSIINNCSMSKLSKHTMKLYNYTMFLGTPSELNDSN
jgi:hypothetical protein